MKKILAALTIAGFAYFNANAQQSQTNACGVKQNKVCRVSANKKMTSCYKTKYAESFQVCKNEYGYYICCQTPGDNNSTYSRYPAIAGTKLEEALDVTSLTYPGESEQSLPISVCGVKQNKVCGVSANKKTTSCYKTKYSENFSVCKSEYGYYICCQTPGDNNSTYSRYPQDTR